LIYRAAHSPRLEELTHQYYRQSEQYRTLGLDLPGRHAEIILEHRAIAMAISAGQREAAEHSAREHHLNTARRIAGSAGSSIQI
jgi:DNA-binding FadR family transcriptional regulator